MTHMHNIKHSRVAVAVLAALLLCVGSTAEASILTFESLGTNIAIPNTFGDNVAAAEPGISVANGSTPNIDLTWSATAGSAWEFFNDAEWSAAQLNEYDVNTSFDLLFTPDPGFGVLVDSFVFDDYAGFAGGNKFNWTLRRDSAAGSVIAQGTETTTDGANLSILTGLVTHYAGSVLLRVEEHSDNVNASPFDQAIDTISFTQVAVPEPASLVLLSLGLLGCLSCRGRF